MIDGEDEYLNRMEEMVREMRRLVVKEEEMTQERYEQIRYLHEEQLEVLAEVLGMDDDYEDEEDG